MPPKYRSMYKRVFSFRRFSSVEKLPFWHVNVSVALDSVKANVPKTMHQTRAFLRLPESSSIFGTYELSNIIANRWSSPVTSVNRISCQRDVYDNNDRTASKR